MGRQEGCWDQPEECQGVSNPCWRKLSAEGSCGLFWLALGWMKVLPTHYKSQGVCSALAGQGCLKLSLSPEKAQEQGASSARGAVGAGREPARHGAVHQTSALCFPCCREYREAWPKSCRTLCSIYARPCKRRAGGLPASEIHLLQSHQHRAQLCTPQAGPGQRGAPRAATWAPLASRRAATGLSGPGSSRRRVSFLCPIACPHATC